MNRNLIRQKLMFFGIDFFFILLAFTIAFYLRLESFYRPDFPFPSYFENAVLITPLWLFFLVWGGKYSLREQRIYDIFRSVTLSGVAAAMLFVLLFFFRREIFFSRLIVVYIILIGTVLLMGSHFLERMYEKWKTKKGKGISRVLIIGVNRAAREIVESFMKNSSRHRPVAIIAPYGGGETMIAGVPVVGKLDILERTTEQENINEIIVCDGAEQVINLLSFAEGRFLQFHIAPEALGVFRENVIPETISGKPLLSLNPSPLFGWGQFFKRGFDVLVSTVMLVLLSPVFLVQKGFSRGMPLFMKEERIGAGGKSFFLYQYRTSRDIFFRDLPNLFNIIRGEMSLLGPRPSRPDEWAEFPPHYKRRMVLRPGLLGLWQIRKIKGEKDDFDAMFSEDMKYIRTWSFLGDIRLIMRAKWELLKRVFRKQK